MELIFRNSVIIIVDGKSLDKITNPINRFDVVGPNLVLRVDNATYKIPLEGLKINDEDVADGDDAIEKLKVVFDETGGGTGGTNTLQEVTAQGNTTEDDIEIRDSDDALLVGIQNQGGKGFVSANDPETGYGAYLGTESMGLTAGDPKLIFAKSNNASTYMNLGMETITADRTVNLPDESGIIALKSGISGTFDTATKTITVTNGIITNIEELT